MTEKVKAKITKPKRVKKKQAKKKTVVLPTPFSSFCTTPGSLLRKS